MNTFLQQQAFKELDGQLTQMLRKAARGNQIACFKWEPWVEGVCRKPSEQELRRKLRKKRPRNKRGETYSDKYKSCVAQVTANRSLEKSHWSYGACMKSVGYDNAYGKSKSYSGKSSEQLDREFELVNMINRAKRAGGGGKSGKSRRSK